MGLIDGAGSLVLSRESSPMRSQDRDEETGLTLYGFQSLSNFY